MNVTSTQQDKMEMVLKQMGAKVESIHGILGYVKIEIGGVEVSYVYNVNNKNLFYLQRVLPYPLGAGTFSTQNEVVDYIRKDIKLFQAASESPTYHMYVDVNYRTHRLSHDLEELFLNYDIPVDEMELLDKEISEIKATIERVKRDATPKSK